MLIVIRARLEQAVEIHSTTERAGIFHRAVCQGTRRCFIMYLKKQSARCFQYSVTYRATWRSHHGQVIGGTIGSLLLTALSSMVPRESIDTTTSTGRRGVYTKTGMGSQRSPPYTVLERALDVTPQAVVCQQLVMDALFLASAPERRDDPNWTDGVSVRSIPAS